MTLLLRRRLGHGGPWPAEAYRFVRREAARARMAPEVWLRRIEGRPADFKSLVAAATVPHSGFFRHPEQMEYLRHALRTLATRGAPIRIFSAGCATGEEPWTIATIADDEDIAVRIVACDVSDAAIARAEEGRYRPRATHGLPGYEGKRAFVVPERLRAMVRFHQASILEPPVADLRGPFDLIFCRNVLIYFEPESIDRAWRIFRERLQPWGAIVVAPVEALLRVPSELEHTGPLGWFERRATQRRHPISEQIPRAALDEARRARDAASKRDGAPMVALERASRLLRSNDLSGAEKLLHTFLADRDDAMGWFLLGETCERRGEKVQARIAYERASKAKLAPEEVDLDTVRRSAVRRARQLG